VVNAYVQIVVDESYPPQANTHSNLPAFLKYLSSLWLPEMNSAYQCGVTSCHLPVLLHAANVPSRRLIHMWPIMANGQRECEEEEWRLKRQKSGIWLNETNQLIAACVNAHFYFFVFLGWRGGGGAFVEERKLVSSAETLISQ